MDAYSQLEAPAEDVTAYARAIEPWDWQFPRDHGAHPQFQTEWWYYTGVLAADAGRRFGYQFTIFRRALSPLISTSESEFRTNDIYMAHFTVSDIASATFYHDVRYSRGGGGLAGATTDPRLRVWLEEWQIQAASDDATILDISAASADYAIDLRLEQVKPPALQGDNGLSAKSAEIGNASYYYSLTRLVTSGRISVGGETYSVRGNTWMDHEFSTSALGENARGWDWFGLIFDNNTELMLGQIRQIDGGIEPVFGGLLIYPDGSARYLDSGDFRIQVTDSWRSPHSDALYPAGWDIEILGAEGFKFEPDAPASGSGAAQLGYHLLGRRRARQRRCQRLWLRGADRLCGLDAGSLLRRRMKQDSPRRYPHDEVAELYDRVRPGYPDALFDDIEAYANLGGIIANLGGRLWHRPSDPVPGKTRLRHRLRRNWRADGCDRAAETLRISASQSHLRQIRDRCASPSTLRSAVFSNGISLDRPGDPLSIGP